MDGSATAGHIEPYHIQQRAVCTGLMATGARRIPEAVAVLAVIMEEVGGRI